MIMNLPTSDHVLLLYGFLSVLLSDKSGEWLNSILNKLTKLLYIQQVFTTSYRPRLNPSFTKGGGGGEGRADPPKGFSSITFEQNNLETSNVA